MEIQTVLLIILYGSILTCGVIGNLLVIVFFGFKTNRDTSFRWLIIQLAVADCICCIISPSLWFYHLATNVKWYLGSFLCKLLTPVGPLTVNVSACILCAIAYERYRAIGHPLKPRFTAKRINLFCLAAWIFSALILIPHFVIANVDSNGVCMVNWTKEEQLAVSIVALIVQSVFPIIFMTIMFVFIQSAFHKKVESVKKEFLLSDKNSKHRQPKSASSRKTVKSRERLATQTIRLTIVIFILCSLPYNVFYVIGVYLFRFSYTTEEIGKHGPLFDYFSFWLSLLVLLNSVTNCFIYAGKFPAYRNFLLQPCRRIKNGRKKRNNTLVSSSVPKTEAEVL